MTGEDSYVAAGVRGKAGPSWQDGWLAAVLHARLRRVQMHHVQMRRVLGGVLPVLAALFVLAGCGGGQEVDHSRAAGVADATASAAANARAPRARGGALDEATARMARAVGAAKPGAAVDIRYEILGKPTAGTPVEMQIVLLPSAGVDTLDTKIGGMEGITLAGQLSMHVDAVEAGKPYRHTVSLLADRAGIFYVTVTAITQIHGRDLARTFAIPFAVNSVAGRQKLQPAAAATSAASRDASGEAIESLPAQESREN